MEIKQALLNSSVHELKEFIGSTIWLDFNSEINIWISELNSMWRNESDPIELYRIQGRIQALEHVLAFPTNALEALEMDIEKERRNG